MSKSASYTAIPYLCFFALLSVWAVVQPQYTWDLLGYIGCSVDSGNPRIVHDAAFAAIRTISNDKEIQADNPYRVDVTANPYHFAEQLPFYSIKPVYVLLIKVFHRAGLPFPRAAVTVSAISNFLLAAVLWLWLSPYLGGWQCAAVGTLIMLSPNILMLSRWATPDCLAMFVAALGLYLIIERELYFWGSSLLLFDIWVRTDALILAGIVLAILAFRRKLDVVQFAALSALALGSYFTINHFAGSYSWSALFYNSFQGGLVAPGETLLHTSFSAYVHQVVRGSYVWLYFGGFALYLLLGGLAIWLTQSPIYVYMIVAVLAARILSYAFYPNGDSRYTAVLFVLIPVALVIAVSQSLATTAFPAGAGSGPVVSSSETKHSPDSEPAATVR